MSKKSPSKRAHLPTHKVVASVAVVAALVLLLSWVLPPLLTEKPVVPAADVPTPMVSAAPATVIPAQQSVQAVEDKAPLPADAVSQADLDAKLPEDQHRVVIADHVVKQIMKRELLGSTGIGCGVAIPHAKHPSVDRLVGSAESISATVDATSKLAYRALSAPVIKTVAITSGASRAAKRLRKE